MFLILFRLLNGIIFVNLQHILVHGFKLKELKT